MFCIVEDGKAHREDLAKACSDLGSRSVAFKNLADVRSAVIEQHGTIPSIFLIDCSLEPLDTGENTDGIALAKELCRDVRFRGVPIWMFTKFLGLGNPVRVGIEELLDGWRARGTKDILKGRRVINPTVEECMRTMSPRDLVLSAVGRAKQLGVDVTGWIDLSR